MSQENLKTILSALRNRLKGFYGDRLLQALLYGSQARGEAAPGSDIDVMIVLKGPVRPGEEIAKTSELVAELSLRWEVVISCLFIDEDRFLHRNGPLLRNIRREGVEI
ncbi:MAG: nucleotidyltransferase domain-containing protein [bacterium]